MAGAYYFSKSDASNGFWQVLDVASTKPCTVNTSFGRYSFKTLPLGISSTPELFHKAKESVNEVLERVRVNMDDFVVWGPPFRNTFSVWKILCSGFRGKV
jgi:hypothetical protein